MVSCRFSLRSTHWSLGKDDPPHLSSTIPESPEPPCHWAASCVQWQPWLGVGHGWWLDQGWHGGSLSHGATPIDGWFRVRNVPLKWIIWRVPPSGRKPPYGKISPKQLNWTMVFSQKICENIWFLWGEVSPTHPVMAEMNLKISESWKLLMAFPPAIVV